MAPLYNHSPLKYLCCDRYWFILALQNIEALLSPFGTVTSTRILRENGISKGVGFARLVGCYAHC